MKRNLFLMLSTLLVMLTSLFNISPIAAKAHNHKEFHEITHIFTHALVADPELAFSANNPMRDAYNIDCITAKEFKLILASLYEKDFMLVDINSVYSGNEKIPFSFPAGKKPLVLSFDDINYYIKKMYLGMNDKLVLQNDRIGSLLNGQVSYDNEVVSVLENFIAEHPDFSYNQARGIICLTGFDGILGYRTQRNSPTKLSEIQKVKPIVQKLKDLGWRFACHSYGHYHMRAISDAKFISDTDKWINEVQPLVGKTDIYVYPYGEHEIIDDSSKVSIKHKYLKNKGFNLFCGVGIKPYLTHFPKSENQALYMDRIPFDGATLRRRKKTLEKYFDFDKVYDFASRPN